MNKPKIIAGIDIGSSKITTIIAQGAVIDATSQPVPVNIVGAAIAESKGIKKGQIVNIEEAVEAISLAVDAAERMAGYNLDAAYLSLGGAHIHSQNSHGVVAVSDPNGEVSEIDIDRVIDAASAISLPQSREVIHVLPREYFVDGETGIKDPIGMSGVRLEVETHIVTASDAAIKNIKKAVKEVGVEISDFVYSGLASAEAVLTPTERELGCVLIDIGGGTTSVAAFIDSALVYSGVIPVGAKNVTNDLAIGLKVSLETAEKIKILVSENGKKQNKDEETDEIDLTGLGLTEIKKISKKMVNEAVIKHRMNEIFTEVRLQLEKEGLANRVPAGVVVTGGGSLIIGCQETAKRMMLLPARLGSPGGVTGLVDDILTPQYSTAIGLIKYASSDRLTEPLTSFAKRIKLPTKGVIGKLFGAIKDLLP